MPETYTLSDNDLRVQLVKRKAFCECSLLAPGRQWGPVRLLALHVHHKGLRRCEVLTEYTTDLIEEVAGGIHVVVRDAFRKISLGLWIRFHQGELSIYCQPAELYENERDLFRLFAVDLLPELMRAESGERLFMPLTTGAACDPAGKPKISDRFLIYGEQERWELLPLLPFCAACHAEGGIMSLAVRGAADTVCMVDTDGAGAGTVGMGFSFRKKWHDPVDFENREIRYRHLPATDSPEIAIARRIRRHAVEDLGMRPLSERAAESSELKYALSASIMKLFHGIQNDTGTLRQQYFPNKLESNTSFDTMMTFGEAVDCLRRLKEAGIERVLTFGVGWNPRGHDGMFPTRLPPDERLGGEAGFRRMLREAAERGYHPSLHDNYTDAYRVSPDWDSDVIIQDEYGEPLRAGLWGGGIQHRIWPLALSDRQLKGEMRRVRATGVHGMYYVDAVGCPLEVNYHPRKGGPRGDHAKGIARVLGTASEVFGAVATECGYLYAAAAADCVFGGGNLNRVTEDTCGPIALLCDRQVPIWELALHGLVILGGNGGAWRSIMRSVLFGLHPLSEWTARPGMFPVLDDSMIQRLKNEFDLLVTRFGYLQAREIIDYQHGEDETYRTKFDDGTDVCADLDNGELLVNGEAVGKDEG
ncbi:MAG: hypothetical protein K9N51_00860 [Candidatus Pacebacteria bacterium]|nr:hypothetical protein [Candidatus Paceibacterota bacterium]